MRRIRLTFWIIPVLLLLAAPLAAADPVLLEQAPSYYWYHGCGPTAIGAIFGYWDVHGLSNLFDASGSSLYSTAAVQDQISSPAHNAKYDSTPDVGSLPIPPATSIADFLHTSVDNVNGPQGYGWSSIFDAPGAVVDYAAYRGYAFGATINSVNGGTWSKLTAEINAGRPMLLAVDSDGDGALDHMVSAIGYQDRGVDGRWYACYTTWTEAETPAWFKLTSVAAGTAWGVGYTVTVTPPFTFQVADGDWHGADNWTGGPPVSSATDSAWIDNAGTARLSSGSAAANVLYVGWHRSGHLVQSGTSSLTVSSLRIGDLAGSAGSVTISSGSLQCGDLVVGSAGTGSLEISNAANITVTGKLQFGRGATLLASSPSRIRLTGTAMENFSTDPAALAGLAQTTLSVENGILSACLLEVAGRDLGATLAGFNTNFAMGGLTIGQGDSARVMLANDVINQPLWSGGEALYVDNLVLSAGSILDLDGLHLYYLSLTDNGGTILDGSIQQVPEPACLLILCGGGWLIVRRRRRQIK